MLLVLILAAESALRTFPVKVKLLLDKQAWLHAECTRLCGQTAYLLQILITVKGKFLSGFVHLQSTK